MSTLPPDRPPMAIADSTSLARKRLRFAHVPLIAVFVFALCLVSPGPAVGATDPPAPRVSSIAVRKLTVSDDKKNVSLALEIKGDHFGSTMKVVVELVNLETGIATAAAEKDLRHDDNLINATVTVPLEKKPVKYEFRVKVGDQSAIPPGHVADYTLDVGKEEKKEVVPKPFEISFEAFKSEEYPNLHSLLITNKSPVAEGGFSSNPALMKVDIVPPGATNVTIQPGSSPYQMLVTFLAAEKFEVKGVVVTVFDPNSLAADRQPKAYSTPFKEKEPKANPNQPKINEIQVLTMQRQSGYGVVRIAGEGFGDYERPPITGEKEMLCCLNRPRNSDLVDDQSDRRYSTEELEALKEDDPKANNPPIQKDAEVCEYIKAGSKCQLMATWRREIEDRVNITLMPRNPDLRVERTQIVYIDDKIIDVYFEFSRWEYYSAPLRLENATVTINKGAVKETRTAAENGDATGTITAVLSSPQTFLATKDIGPSRDKNLEYRYVVMNDHDASDLFGSGVGENFYVIELTVVNNGKKKVAVPLGSIQAEVAWEYGLSKNKSEFFEQGPPTLPSLPLAGVTGYFDAYHKAKGRRAKIFNTLEGVATLATTMIPIINELKTPTLILSTGFIPGLRKAVGDLSSEQLQRLTSMSWENIEEIVPSGSKTKFVYIPRADQFFGEPRNRSHGGSRTRKHIVNLLGVEVAGFEVIETEKKLATEQPKN